VVDGDEFRLVIDQARVDVRRTGSAGPAPARGVLPARLPLTLVLRGLLLRRRAGDRRAPAGPSRTLRDLAVDPRAVPALAA
jgi:hypothetical protein